MRSGRTDRVTAATRCWARSATLRIASGARPRRGLAGRAHADPQARSPQNKVYFVAAAFPVPAAKTNLAMIQPTIPGWKAETVGDDIAWMRFGKDGRLYAINPEFGFFGVAPGTSFDSNPNAMETIEPATPCTPTSRSPTTAMWWEGIDGDARPSDRLARQRLDPGVRRRPRTPTRGTAPRWSSARRWRPSGTTRRACRSRRSCSVAAAKTTVPLVTETATGTGVFMVPRSAPADRRRRGQGGHRPPRPDGDAAVHGYNVGDTSHWMSLGKNADAASCPRSSTSTGSAVVMTAASCGPAW